MTRTKTGITFIVQHVLWISGLDSLEKYMNAICHTYSQEKKLNTISLAATSA